MVAALPVVEFVLDEYWPLLLLFDFVLLDEVVLEPADVVSTTVTRELELLLDFVFPASS